MPETIFSPSATPTETPVIPSTTQTVPQELVDFVGEGKKYKTVDEALKSVPHAQKHILTLEEEMKKVKEELAARKSVEQLIDDVKSGVTTTAQPSVPVITEDKIAELVQTTLTKTQQQEKAKQNTIKVVSSFQEKFGEKAEEVYNKIAVDSGLSVAELNILAAKSPEVVFKLAGFDKPMQHSPSKTQSSINSQAVTSSAQPTEKSARVPLGAKSKDLLTAWKIAGEKVGKQV